MNRCWIALTGLCLVGCLVVAKSAPGAELLPPDQARQLGLERIWFTQIDVDAGFGRMRHISQHVSSTKAVTFHKIRYDGGEYRISERELDLLGKPIGLEQAKKAADLKLKDLTNLKLNPKLETITVPQITLYVVTDTGVVQALDAETGRVLWKSGIGNPRFPAEAAGASDDYVAATNGSDLFLLKATNGEVVWKRRTVGSPGAGPVLSDTFVFVPMVSGAMEAYPLLETKFPPSIYRSQGRAMFQPVYTGTNVAWPTDRGHLYVAGARENRISFRLEANDAISSPPTVMQPGKLVVTSIDGFVYCLHEFSGTILWRFSAGEPIVETPLAYDNTVYTVTTDRTLFAIDGELGQERWTATGLTKIVGATKGRLYCLDNSGRLNALDITTGARLGTMPATAIDVPYVNKETDRLILASGRGLVQCFRETGAEFPTIHIGLSKKETKPIKPLKKTEKPAEEAAPAGEADPFGGGGEKMEGAAPAAAPKPDAGKAGDDPFGG